jgi:hypothetical protein
MSDCVGLLARLRSELADIAQRVAVCKVRANLAELRALGKAAYAAGGSSLSRTVAAVVVQRTGERTKAVNQTVFPIYHQSMWGALIRKVPDGVSALVVAAPPSTTTIFFMPAANIPQQSFGAKDLLLQLCLRVHVIACVPACMCLHVREKSGVGAGAGDCMQVWASTCVAVDQAKITRCFSGARVMRVPPSMSACTMRLIRSSRSQSYGMAPLTKHMGSGWSARASSTWRAQHGSWYTRRRSSSLMSSQSL